MSVYIVLKTVAHEYSTILGAYASAESAKESRPDVVWYPWDVPPNEDDPHPIRFRGETPGPIVYTMCIYEVEVA